ncbi:cyclopropane-fatty-acyl-phospholipid synthase family protein [Pseudorhodoferax sp. Leaf274]|uniref:SAM-dependent methyltransferase n=1 Tax=Pseudorhodoferax sp. Leaf274 TaxID=1736318 RepID=UPI00138F06CE|nr:class I SAM-dependent methyltransferase [Pseudorhodoferax sp. Leaf274]
MTTLALASLSRRLAVLSLACLTTSAALAQNSSYEPQRGQAGKDVIWIPTPDETVTRMLQMVEVKPNDRVFDLGSGDGKIAIAAAREFGARATGLEYNPDMVGLSNRRAQEAGVADKVQFRQADIFQADFSSATVVTMYLLPELNLRLRPLLFKMTPGTRVVSHSFTMGDWAPDETARAGYGDVYMWHIPANASGSWKLSGAGLPDTSLTLAQRYQVVSGDAIFGELRASLVRPRISGAQISFGLRDPKGQLWQFEGQVAGARITGTATRPGQAGVPFEARRNGEASPIAATTAAAEQEASQIAASLTR